VVSSFKVLRPEREADRSLPSNPKIKNAWSYASTHFLDFTLLSSQGPRFELRTPGRC
jgi:hypothetical protein